MPSNYFIRGWKVFNYKEVEEDYAGTDWYGKRESDSAFVEKRNSRSGVLEIDPPQKSRRYRKMCGWRELGILLTPPAMRHPWNGGRVVCYREIFLHSQRRLSKMELEPTDMSVGQYSLSRWPWSCLNALGVRSCLMLSPWNLMWWHRLRDHQECPP
jgi:hypothetical protein